jgi:CRISPR-associated endonuclease/helicase Cas3
LTIVFSFAVSRRVAEFFETGDMIVTNDRSRLEHPGHIACAYFAHSSPKGNAPPEGWQLLADHLRGVASLGRQFAQEALPDDESFGNAAYAAGLLHDLGKYRPEFQLYLQGRHPKNERTYHKQAGAAVAAQHRRLDIAFAIAGHHGGMPDRTELKEAIAGPCGTVVAEAIHAASSKDCPELAKALDRWPAKAGALHFDLWVRLLFSCLVDADWQDTGNFARRHAPTWEPLHDLPCQSWLANVLAYISVRSQKCPDRRIAGIRQEILEACVQAAESPPGLFSMTVPTGGGKTLSALAFGLGHAKKHGLRRIIYVAPYLSIIEQNAREIRRALGVADDALTVFEHHSLAEPEDDTGGNAAESAQSARRAENWDAPVIVTTNVQFFQSLFSNRPGQCRKLHNIAGSVVILDECQTLPPDVLAPTCSMLHQVSNMMRCSIVLCTATQPAWKKRADFADGLEKVREIVPPQLDLFSRLRRVTVTWPADRNDSLEWVDIAARMSAETAALCIVNTRKAARDLFEHLRARGCDDIWHLSTAMCPAHRLMVIDEVKTRLAARRPCRLVSTQLIECGCDVDFPLVLREMAPLEAIIQSAGRCNREGLLNSADGAAGGKVIVFRSAESRLPPDRWYRAGRDKVEQDFLAMNRMPDIGRPEDVHEYFQRLYRAGELDQFHIQDFRKNQRFAETARAYRLIDDFTMPVVISTWTERTSEVQELLQRIRRQPSRKLFRRLAAYEVNLRFYEMAAASAGLAEDQFDLKIWVGGYDSALGMAPAAANDALIV